MSCVLDARFSELSTLSNPPPPYSTSSIESNRIAHHGRSISATDERTVQKRPLPPPPQLRSSTSTPSLTSLSRQNTRPLPSLPESRPSPVPHTAPPTVSEQPVMYYLASSSSPPPPPNRASAPIPVRTNTVRTRPKAISLQTRPEALKPKTTIPPVPEPPTPVTALKKRSAKLKNFYGDAPPAALLVQQQPNRTVPPSSFASAGLPPSSQRSSKHELTRAEAAEIARQLKQFELDDLWQGRQLQTSDSDDDDSSSDDDDEELIKSCGDEPFLVKGVVFDVVNVAKVSKRWSRRWILETKGRKSEVQDYSLVLKALREL